jgi:hypothetical protein
MHTTCNIMYTEYMQLFIYMLTVTDSHSTSNENAVLSSNLQVTTNIYQYLLRI